MRLRECRLPGRGYDFLSFRTFLADFKRKLFTFDFFYVNYLVFCWLRSSLDDLKSNQLLLTVLYVNFNVF